MARHSLAEAADLILGTDSGLADPQRWVTRQLLDCRFSGLKVGRRWFMTDTDIQAALATMRSEAHAETPTPAPIVEMPTPIGAGISRRSQRRIKRSA